MSYNNVNVNVSGGQSIIRALQNYNTIILKPNIVDNRNVLTQEMMGERHTKYIIRWNYSLEGATINVPEDCIIEFAGGTIDNGTIVGNNTILMYSKPIDEVCLAERYGTFIYNTTVADEEDITSASGQLKFKDRPATDGMGRKILRKNIVNGVNTLTQSMMQATNTIYVIQYDFTLDTNITVPANCVLEFDGGSLDGVNDTYTLTGNNTLISYNSYNILKGLKVAGTFRNDSIVIDIFDDADWADKMSKSIMVSKYILLNRTSSYTQDKTLNIDGYWTLSHIEGNNCRVTCSALASISVSAGVQMVKIDNLQIFKSGNVEGTALTLTGESTPVGNQIRRFDCDNLYINGFNLGIYMLNVRCSTFNNLNIDCNNGITYSGKSAEVNITNSLFYASTNNSGIGIYTIDGSTYPEGLSVINTLFYHFENPIKVADIFGLKVTSCWMDSGTIMIEHHNYIDDITISDSWCYSCKIYNYNANNVIVTGCTFENVTGYFLNLDYSPSQCVVDNCIVTSTDASADNILILASGDGSATDCRVSNCTIANWKHIIVTNTSPTRFQMLNVNGPDNGNNYYLTGGTSTIRNCVNVADTPMLNEVRRVDGVAKYWDGSAWQAM